MKLRQIVLAARELDPLVTDICSVFGTEVAFRDPGVKEFGLRNAVMPLGDQFLEVVSPVEASAPAQRYLDRKGDGGYMLIIQVDDLDREMERVGSLGIRIVWKADLPDIRGRHLHPKDTGGTLLSLDEARPPESWRWAGPRWQSVKQSGIVRGIAVAEIQSEDPDALADRWSAILGRSASGMGAGAETILLDDGAIRFVPAYEGRGEGLAGFDLEVEDRKLVLANARERGLPCDGTAVTLGGARFVLI